MSRLLTILAAGSALALVSIAAPTSADARWRGGGIAAGVIGGIAAGAAIAGAVNGPYYGSPYAYGPGYGYAPGYAYGSPYYYGGYGGSTCDYRNYSYDRQLQGTC